MVLGEHDVMVTDGADRCIALHPHQVEGLVEGLALDQQAVEALFPVGRFPAADVLIWRRKRKRPRHRRGLLHAAKFWLPDLDSNQGPAD